MYPSTITACIGHYPFKELDHVLMVLTVVVSVESQWCFL